VPAVLEVLVAGQCAAIWLPSVSDIRCSSALS